MHRLLFPNALLRAALLQACFAAGLSAEGEVLLVTTVDDSYDIAGATIADLPGPDGKVSFREALAVANQVDGPQAVEFAIPPSEWWLADDQALLRLEDGAFFVTGDETTLDFASQTTHVGDTNPNGGEVGIYGLQPNGWGVAAIFVNADNCVIRGLDRVLQRGYGVEVIGDGNRVIGCNISGAIHAAVVVEGQVGDPATGNIIGGTQPGDRNVLSGGSAGVRVDGPTEGTIIIGNTLVGSSYAGVEVRGAYCCPGYTPVNTRIGGASPPERNWIADNGSFSSEGFPQGNQVQVEWAESTVVEGNYIGTTEAGDVRYPGASGTVGVGIRASSGTIVRNNLIAGMRKVGINHHAGKVFGTGISVYGPNTGVELYGNLVGTDASGAKPIPNLDGISFGLLQGPPTGGIVGGPKLADTNVIAFQERHGVIVANGVAGVTIEGNSIFENGELGIELSDNNGGVGVDLNDPADADAGANGGQNYPVLDAASADGSGVRIQGTLESEPNQSYAVAFYASSVCDPTGNGEGERFLGSIEVLTDAMGAASFDEPLAQLAIAGERATATATHLLTGSTSEFSACIEIDGGGGHFVDLGHAMSGVLGAPVLVGSGTLESGAATTFMLNSACPDSVAAIVIGTHANNTPLLGGTLVPAPQVIVPHLTDEQGTSSFVAAWPALLPSGISVYFQEWIVDAAAIQGFSASNAVKAVVP